MAQPGARVCVCSGCRRMPAEGQSICGRCSKHVPAEVWLLIHDHADAYRTEGAGPLASFIYWSWGVTLNYAAREATSRRYAKRGGLDPDQTANRWIITPTGEVNFVRRDA